MTVTVTPADLALYMGDVVDDARAAMLINDAITQATAIVNPLPAGAESVIRSAAARAYSNPVGILAEHAGPFSVTRTSPGVYLTRGERRTLRSLAGQGGGAFTVDPTPVGAGTEFRDPLESPTDADVVTYLEDQGY